MPKYDYIIIGAGASGLLLADALGSDPYFVDKKIAILDKDDKKKNDRTWCFWETGKGEFDAIVHKTWPKVYFAGKKLRQSSAIAPYQYKMVRGLDFYNHYLSKLRDYPNITFIQEEVTDITPLEDGSVLVTGKDNYQTKQVFNSIFDYRNFKKDTGFPILQQHFLGWFVKTERPIFKVDEATFMDFSIPQKGNTRFMYVLPFSETEALVEYTLFSETPLPKAEYEDAIKEYLKDKNAGTFDITETERGNIPMTCYNFDQHNSEAIFNIGMAGGWAKASTGYTFKKSHKNVKALVAHLKRGKEPISFSTKSRFWFYDLLLLDILHRDNSLGQPIFESLFRNRKPQLIFKFLDEETSLVEDVFIMMAPNPWPFIKSLLGRVF